MKKIFNIFMLLCAAVTIMAQTKSFVVTDKSGNSQFVQKLIFQKNELDERFSWSTNSSGYESTFDIENLQFIARANEEMKTASADEVKQLLEEVSGKDEANASAIVSVLKDNPNVEETYTADDDNVIVQMKGEQGKTVYPMYDLKSPYSELEEVDAIESEMTTKQMVKHNDPVGFYHGDVAIFNFFDGVESYEVQNRMVRFIRKLFYNGGYTVEYYGKNYEIPNRGNFSGENVYEVLRHSSDYKAILIFSHGFVGDDGVRYFATNDLAPHDIIGGYRIYDKELQRHYDTHTVERYNIDPNCILYLGPCYSSPNKGYDDDDFYYDKTVVGWSNKNSIAQVDAAMLFYLMLTEQYTLTRALESTDSQDPYNTRSHRYSTTIFPDIRLESNYKPDNYPNLTLKYDLKHHIKKNNNDGYQYLPIKGSLPNHNRLILRFHVKSVTNRYEQVVQSGVLEKNVNGFTTNLRIPNYLPEGIYKISASIAPIGQSGQDFITIRVINPYVFSFSSNLGENFNLPTLSESETKAPEIFDTNNQPVEEIIVRNGSKREFLIDGYSGHSFVAESYDESVAKVSVSGNRLTVKGVGKGETVISVIDRVNKLSVVKDVTVTGSSSPSSEKETFTVNGVSFNMIKVGKGTFQMGNNSGNYFERPVHQVTLTNEYYVGETEVTQALWKAVMGSNPSYNTSSKQFPVEGISWEDCQEFIMNLNSLTGRYFRLPTEAEWEFAARGGNASRGYKYSGSNDPEEVAWCEENSSGKTHEVATKIPNELGIYDMSGNVWEMCNDLFSEYSSEAQINPTGGSRGNSRMIRGCGKSNPASEVTVTVRSSISSDERELGDCGFRLALTSSSVSPLQLSTNAITLDNGLSENISIISGTGSYSVSSSNSNVVTASLSGTTIVVRAVSTGRATVTVTDTMSGQTATIAVTVVDPTPDLTISVNMVSMKVGGSSTVEITSGSGSYTATSSAPAIATAVISGNSVVITANSCGSTFITVTDTVSGQTVTIVATVIADLAISENTVSLKVGGTSTVKITSGNGNYRVVSNKPAIATAALNGTTITITGVAAGKANITVTDTQSNQTATIAVTVTAADNPTSDVVAVDLGLPSGTKWANMNVGASKPEDYGGYYAWGETEEKEVYDWSTYIHCDGTQETCHDIGNNIAGTNYDVAHVKWGGDWKMPTLDQVRELLENCSTVWITVNGINGRRFTGPNGNSIFLPAAGVRGWVDSDDVESHGTYWSSTYDVSDIARGLFFNSSTAYWYYAYLYRAAGRPVRPVIGNSIIPNLIISANNVSLKVGGTTTVKITAGSSNFKVVSNNRAIATAVLIGSTITITGVAAGTATITVTDELSGQTKTIAVTVIDDLVISANTVSLTVGGTSTVKITAGNGDYRVVCDKPDVAAVALNGKTITVTGVAVGTATITVTDTRTNQTATVSVTVASTDIFIAVDLGLPSGTKWANMNVGASKPEDYGGYYAWGETGEKDVYDWSTYIHCDGSSSTCHDIGNDIAGTNYDVAHVKWGGSWKMPTFNQVEELLNNCSSEWTTVNGVNGRRFTGPNGNSVFLPAAGNRWRSDFDGTDISGRYWSSTSNDLSGAYYIHFGSGGEIRSYNQCINGLSVRPVIGNCTIPNLSISENTVSLKVRTSSTIEITSGSGIYSVVSDNPAVAITTMQGTRLEIIALAAGTANITVTDTQSNQTASIAVTVIVNDAAVNLGYCPDTNHPHMIDLGLSSGTKWACCNVGASKPLDYGGYYAWGETEERDVYDHSHIFDSDCFTDIGTKNIAGTDNDVAYVKWGSPWKMPTEDQVMELVYNCYSIGITVDGIHGCELTGPNGNRIIIPFSGRRYGSDFSDVGSRGFFWSSTSNYGRIYRFSCDLGGVYYGEDWHFYGLSVRPVR